MTDRLTPAQLRDLADLIWSPDISPPKPPNNFYLVWSCLMEISEGLRNSAARREAEAKPVNVSQPVCHEPGGCIAPAACVQFGKCPQKPEAAPQGEREGPGSAAAPDMLAALNKVTEVLFHDAVNGRDGEPLAITREQINALYEVARVAIAKAESR